MRTSLIPLALLLAACDNTPQVTFADTSILLPDDPAELPDLPGRDAVIANCTACHSPSTMLQQPRIPREKWQSQVTKMIETYKAPVDEQAIPAIVDYLVAVQTVQAETDGGITPSP